MSQVEEQRMDIFQSQLRELTQIANLVQDFEDKYHDNTKYRQNYNDNMLYRAKTAIHEVQNDLFLKLQSKR